MSDGDRNWAKAAVPTTAPTDLPMPPYRFQRDDAGGSPQENGTAKQAADILRQANLLSCSAASRSVA